MQPVKDPPNLTVVTGWGYIEVLGFHIGIVNVNLLSVVKERWSDVIIEQFKFSSINFDVNKLNNLFKNLTSNGVWCKANIFFHLPNLFGCIKDLLIIHL